MRELRRGLTALVAILAITLHALAMTYALAQAAFDPTGVLCLNGAHDGAGISDPVDNAPARDCGHCVLCFAAATPERETAATPVVFTTRPAGIRRNAIPSARHAAPFPSPEIPRGPPATI